MEVKFHVKVHNITSHLLDSGGVVDTLVVPLYEGHVLVELHDKLPGRHVLLHGLGLDVDSPVLDVLKIRFFQAGAEAEAGAGADNESH